MTDSNIVDRKIEWNGIEVNACNSRIAFLNNQLNKCNNERRTYILFRMLLTHKLRLDILSKEADKLKKKNKINKKSKFSFSL